MAHMLDDGGSDDRSGPRIDLLEDRKSLLAVVQGRQRLDSAVRTFSSRVQVRRFEGPAKEHRSTVMDKTAMEKGSVQLQHVGWEGWEGGEGGC